ncbi:hypothetical protein D7I44_17895 (plasmid) [Gryllotalpicola protaetiae]|uniref:Uncharacterized protein n=2 Tax=Gryllotalpicola protaetiae TaxID=2419771 RepID=A0A387BWN1_9MICO|nr:hypothetical protein D7I44_17895 [Gryllotalpicola protaetiae]
MDTYGVPAAQQDGLIAKIEAGQPLDADTGAAPVSTSTVTIGYENETVERYADGSFAATSTPVDLDQAKTIAASQSAGHIVPLASGNATGCSYSYGAGVAVYDNCLVKRSTVALTMWFRVNYHVASSSTEIEALGSWDMYATGAACQETSFKITHKQATTSPATARLTGNCTVVGNLGTSTPYLEFRVTSGGSESWTSNF